MSIDLLSIKYYINIVYYKIRASIIYFNENHSLRRAETRETMGLAGGWGVEGNFKRRRRHRCSRSGHRLASRHI